MGLEEGRESRVRRSEYRDRVRRGDSAIRRAMAGNRTVFESRERIIGSGEAHEKIYLLREGWACRARALDDGRRQIIGIILPDDLFGVKSLARVRRIDAVECLTQTAVSWIGVDQLQALADADPDVALRLSVHFVEEQQRLLARVVSLGLGNAEEKISSFLLDVHRRSIGRVQPIQRTTFQLPMTQQQIGDYLGLTVVHVNRILRRLREADIVAIGKSEITLRDSAALLKLAVSLDHSIADAAAAPPC